MDDVFRCCYPHGHPSSCVGFQPRDAADSAVRHRNSYDMARVAQVTRVRARRPSLGLDWRFFYSNKLTFRA